MYASLMIENFREHIKEEICKTFRYYENDITRMKILAIVSSFILKLSYLMHIDFLIFKFGLL